MQQIGIPAAPVTLDPWIRSMIQLTNPYEKFSRLLQLRKSSFKVAVSVNITRYLSIVGKAVWWIRIRWQM